MDLYGRTDNTFDGKHEALATVFGAWAPGAVKNADLPFSTRRLAERAPETLGEQAVIDFAAGLLSISLDVTVADARKHLEESAIRADVPLIKLAEIIRSLYSDAP